ncbi:MAG: hypothetical protein GY850_14830 [bacterium]|nr:hypothetical protein [bacterium]
MTKNTASLICVLLMIIFGTANCDMPSLTSADNLTILFTGDALGKIEPCG